MLIGDIGNIRSGKTLLMTKFLVNLVNIPENKDKGFTAYSNYHVSDPRVKYITVDDFINLNMEELNSGIVGCQELWAWLYSRLSGSEINRAINPIILQSGKRGFDIMWDGQLASSVDLTVRRLTDKFWVARPPLKDYTEKFRPVTVAFRYAYVTPKTIFKFNFPVKRLIQGKLVDIAAKYYNLYDTREQANLEYGKKNIPRPAPDNNIENPINSREPQTPIIPSTGQVEGSELDELLKSGQVHTMTLTEPEERDSMPISEIQIKKKEKP